MTTSVCARTAPLERAGDDVAYARLAVSGQAPPGRIIGQAREALDGAARWVPLRGVPIALTRKDERLAAVSDSHGRFVIEPTVAGTYVVDVSLPGSSFTLKAGRSIELPHERACGQLSIDVLVYGRLSGRVVDPHGKAVAGLTVVLSSPRPGTLHAESWRQLTGDDGRYEFGQAPPGLFEVSVQLPGIEDGEGAPATHRGRIAGGQHVSLDSFVIAGTPAVVRIEGTVHGTDAAALAGARVFLKSVDDGGHILGAAAVTDSLGRFVLAAVEGERYQIFAEGTVRDGDVPVSFFSDPVTFTAAVAMAPRRLTVRRRF